MELPRHYNEHASKKNVSSELAMLMLTYPERNAMHDLLERILVEIRFVKDCIAAGHPGLIENDTAEHWVKELTEQVFASAMLMHGRADGIISKNRSDHFKETLIFRSEEDRKSTRLNSSHSGESRMPSSA